MYIKKYWGNFIGGSDDSLNLVAFLEDQKQEEIPLSEIFAKIGLDKQNWDFRQTVEYLEFTHSDGVEMDFHFAIDVVTDLAAILLECSVSGSVNLQDLDEYNTPARRIRITATPEEHEAMDKALADFVHAPLEYDISEMMGEDEITDMASQVEMLRKELYEASGRNRNYHVKAEDVKDLLPGWEGADGCIATNRITVEGCKVGYCYREKPDGGWDSGWRFTAGDESEEYMDDPNNAGIYKLNTICNDDPDIIPLLHTPAPCAFEREENGVFQQIKEWNDRFDGEKSSEDGRMHLQADIRRAFLKMEEVEQGHEWDSIEAEIREEFDRLEKGNNELGNKYDQQVAAVRSQVDSVIRSKDVRQGRIVLDDINSLFVAVTLIYQLMGFIDFHLRNFNTIQWKDATRARQLLQQGKEIANTNPSESSTDVVLNPTQDDSALKKAFFSLIFSNTFTAFRSSILKSDAWLISNPAAFPIIP